MNNEASKADSEDKNDSLYFAYSASLRIMGEIEDFDAISHAMGLKPTHVHRRGERLFENSEPFQCDAWMYTVPVGEEQPLDEHIRSLWSQIRSHREYLLQLKKKMKVDIFLGYRSNCDHAGFEVSPQSLEMFIELDVPFGVSVIIA